MKAVGMDTLVFIRGGFEGRTIFPSENFFCLRKDDLVDFILKEAEKRDMKNYFFHFLEYLRIFFRLFGTGTVAPRKIWNILICIDKT